MYSAPSQFIGVFFYSADACLLFSPHVPFHSERISLTSVESAIRMTSAPPEQELVSEEDFSDNLIYFVVVVLIVISQCLHSSCPTKPGSPTKCELK